MSTDLAILAPDQIKAAVEYADRLACSGMIPDAYQGKPANVLWAMEYGRTLGLSTVAAINGVNVIKGKPTASAALISALVRRAGHKMRIGYDQASMTGWAEVVRADDPEFTFRSEWDLARAVEAELCEVKDGKPYAVDSKGNTLPWKKFYPSMVKARAVTEVARDACEEVLFGLHYTPEELGAEVDEDGTPVTVRPMPERPAECSRPQTPTVDEWSTPAPEQQIEDAEIVRDSPELATDAQKSAVNALIAKKYGPKTRDERLTGLSRFTGRELSSSSELTKLEASRFIDAVKAEPDFVLTEEAVVAAAEELATVAEPPQIAEEERLRDRVESAGDSVELEQVMQGVFDAEAAGVIGSEAFGRLQAAGSARLGQLKDLAASRAVA